MPDTARIFGEVLCRSCETPLLNSIRVQWGVLPRLEYRVGDAVKWLYDPSGTLIQPFKLVKVSPESWRWNCGDPQFENVILFDEDIYTGNHKLECPACNIGVAACIATVLAGVFEKVEALLAPEVDRILGSAKGKGDIVIIEADGSYNAREDWFDPTVEYIGERAVEVR